MVQISLYSSTNRPKFWDWFYSHIKTDLTFEVVFVGDEPPQYVLPSNLRFIYSPVKVCQCADIAARNCTGEVIMQVGDDIELFPYCIDKLYEQYQKENDYKCLIWPRYGEPGNDLTEQNMGPVPYGMCGVMSKKLFDEIGGHDPRYFCNTYDVDLQFRAQSSQYGARYVWVNDAFVFERKELTPGGLHAGAWYRYDGKNDVAFLQYQWYTDKQTRKSESTLGQVTYVVDETYLTVSQGTSYDWDLQKRKAGK